MWSCLSSFSRCLAALSPAAVIITSSMKVDPSTGLSTSSSTLQYTASKDDIGAVFACVSRHELDNQEKKLDPLPVHCKWDTAPPSGYIEVLHCRNPAQMTG